MHAHHCLPAFPDSASFLSSSEIKPLSPAVQGKGYPDVATRVFARKLAFDLQLPTFVLVDCDPHGVDIMLTYRFGSRVHPVAGAIKPHSSAVIARPCSCSRTSSFQAV